MYVCMYVCMYVRTYVRMYVCMCTNTSHSHAATHIHLYSVCIVKAHGLIDKAIIIKLTTSCYSNR